MRKKHTFALALLLVAGCRDTTPPFNPLLDLAMKPADLAGADLSGQIPPDLSTMGPADMAKVYKEATPNKIDTNDPAFGDGVDVKLTQMVAVTPVAVFLDRPFCKTEVWVQDPTCMAPPCGILLVARGPMLMPADGGTRDCPAADKGDSVLKDVRLGDNFDVWGRVDAYKPMMVTQHRVDIDRLEMSMGPKKTITPITVDNPALFVTNTGGGWAMYEGTLITLKPQMGELTIQNTFPNNRPTFETAPGPALFAYTFLFNEPRVVLDGGVMLTFPLAGMKFNSITGVPATLFNGQIYPRAKTDFFPENGL